MTAGKEIDMISEKVDDIYLGSKADIQEKSNLPKVIKE